MNNVIEMVPAILLDEMQKEEVLASSRRIRTDNVALRKASMAIGRDGAFIESLADKGSWQVLGYRHQHEFRIAEGLGRSNWYRVVAIASQFLEVDRDTYMAMSLENAERLSIEPRSVRLDPENLQRAATMTAKEFSDLMTTEGAHRDGKPKHEKWVEIKWKMRAAQREAIERDLAAWAMEHGIEYNSESGYYALELMLAEYRERPTLAGFILESIPRLTSTIRSTTDIGELKSQLADYLEEMSNIVKVCCGEVQEEESA